jgi:hypothetical protein
MCKDRGVKVDLSYEDLLHFVSKKTCEYCDKELVWVERQTKKTSGATNLDRKESDREYSKDNCVSCCWECNRIKGNVYTFDEMKIIGALFKQLRETGVISSRLSTPGRNRAKSPEHRVKLSVAIKSLWENSGFRESVLAERRAFQKDSIHSKS